MATTRLPSDFVEFLKLLNENEVEYLVVGGYAVGHHGYVRATADFDVWIRSSRSNAERLVDAMREFGFDLPDVNPELFLVPDRVVRMGTPPVRLEVQTTISGVDFNDCWKDREVAEWDGVTVNVISLEALKTNKRAAGRPQDLADLDHLP